MNLPNKIIEFLSFKIEKKCGKDHLVRLLFLTISSSIIFIYFLVLAIISIFSSNILLLMLSLSASILIAINQIIIVKKLQLNSYIYFPIVLPALIFQFFLWTGSISAIGTLIIALLPLITIGLLGFNKGAIFSLIFAIVAAMGLFLPLEINGGYNLDIVFKVNFFVSYFIIIFIAYLFDVVKQNSKFE